jgi:hypothetical protein
MALASTAAGYFLGNGEISSFAMNAKPAAHPIGIAPVVLAIAIRRRGHEEGSKR